MAGSFLFLTCEGNPIMSFYIVNKNAQRTGEHEIHLRDGGCGHMPLPENRIDLGWHEGCHSAVKSAKNTYPSHEFDGCAYCVPVCHTR